MLTPTRREALAFGASLTAASLTLPAQAEPAADASLNALALAKGLRFGSSIGTGTGGGLTASFDDPRYRALMVAECGVMVCENEMKWYVLRPDVTTFNFEPADRLVAFAKAHGLSMRGHNLLWQRQQYFPKWFETYDFGSRPASEAERLLTTHIRTVIGRYGAVVHSWDVVNEAVNPDTGHVRQTSFTKYLGPAALEIAFHTAREAAPKAQLVYNDYMSWEAGNERHRDGVLELLTWFKSRALPVDALGVQSHIGTNSPDKFNGFGKSQAPAWRDFLNSVTGQGFDLVVTEFDVNDSGLPDDITKRDRIVAEYARTYLELMLSYSQTREVLAWGLVDNYSWLQDFGAKPGDRPKRPCPYDANYKAKPLREAIAAAFRAAPARAALPA